MIEILIILGIFWSAIGIFPTVWVIMDLVDGNKPTKQGKVLIPILVIIFLPTVICVGTLIFIAYLIGNCILPLLDKLTNLTEEKKGKNG